LIVCERCGTQNAEGENFCGACGAFLDWDAAPTPAVESRPQASQSNRATAEPQLPPRPPEPQPPVAPDPVAAPDPVTALKPVVAEQPVVAQNPAVAEKPVVAQNPAVAEKPGRPVVPEPARPVPDRTTAPRPPENWPTPPTDPPPVAPVSATPVSATPVSPTPVSPTPVSPTPVSPADAARERRAPEAVKPGEQKPRRLISTEAPADEPPPNEGDLICGDCGAGNVPSRKFCRRCGASLLTAQVMAKPPWWRRLLNRLRGRRYEAGYRRSVRQPVRIQGRLILIFTLAALILLAAFPGRPYLSTGVELVKDRTRAHVRVTPVDSRASSSAKGAGPDRVYDTVSNQYWAPAPTGVGEGQWFEVDLPEPTRVLDLILHTGVALDQKTFLTQGRPREVAVTFTSDTGKTTSHVIRLRDEPGKQEFDFRADRVVRVRITLRSAYGVGPNRRVAVAELEVFGRG
jgi:hypothetical protein